MSSNMTETLYHELVMAQLKRFIRKRVELTKSRIPYFLIIYEPGKATTRINKTIVMPTFMAAVATGLMEAESLRFWQNIHIKPHDIKVDGCFVTNSMADLVYGEAGVHTFEQFRRRLTKPCQTAAILELESGIPSTSKTSVP